MNTDESWESLYLTEKKLLLKVLRWDFITDMESSDTCSLEPIRSNMRNGVGQSKDCFTICCPKYIKFVWLMNSNIGIQTDLL